MPELQKKSIIDELKTLIVEVTNINLKPAEIDINSTFFKTGLGLDSIDLLEILVQVEKRWGLRLMNDAEGQLALRSIETMSVAICNHLQTI